MSDSAGVDEGVTPGTFVIGGVRIEDCPDDAAVLGDPNGRPPGLPGPEESDLCCCMGAVI